LANRGVSDICISRHNASARFKRYRIFSDSFVANFPQSASAKETSTIGQYSVKLRLF